MYEKTLHFSFIKMDIFKKHIKLLYLLQIGYMVRSTFTFIQLENISLHIKRYLTHKVPGYI